MAGNSKGGTKAAETAKKKYGKDFHSKNGKLGGQKKTPGYFGWLKENKPEEFKNIQDKANKARARKREEAERMAKV